jgi:3-hydroxy-9,10-secoandrosta-1,3,5(10)-triene-9,17-dione monooxygenase reductase component
VTPQSPRTDPDSADTAAGLRRAFRCVPQPVAVVSSLTPSGRPVGMTVSSFTSVSLQPPLVLFCPAVESQAWAAARRRGVFAINVLGRQNAELALRFAGSGDRFEDVRTRSTHRGIPMLADALAVLICDVSEEHPAGDHTVVLAHVRAICDHRDGIGLDTVSLRARAGRQPRDLGVGVRAGLAFPASVQ